MRRLVISAGAIVLAAGYVIVASAKDALAPQVLMIGIGAKNPTFDESKYPDLQFVYTPGLAVAKDSGETARAVMNTLTGGIVRETVKGEPKLIETWWDKEDLRGHGLLFDKKGVVAWEGEVESDDVLESEGEGIEESLEDALKAVVKKGKEGNFDGKKTFDLEKNDGDEAVLEMKIPAFDVTALSGEKKSIKNYVEAGKPILAVFFQISSVSDLNTIEERMKKADKEDNKAEAWKAAADKEALENLTELVKGIEKELFGKEIKK